MSQEKMLPIDFSCVDSSDSEGENEFPHTCQFTCEASSSSESETEDSTVRTLPFYVDSETETDDSDSELSEAQQLLGIKDNILCETNTKVDSCETCTHSKKRQRKPYTSTKRNLAPEPRYRKKQKINCTTKSITDLRDKQFCRCGHKCHQLFTFGEVKKQREIYHSLLQNEKREFLISDIRRSSTLVDNKFVVRYAFQNTTICRTAYENLWPVSHKHLTTVVKQLVSGVYHVSPRTSPIGKETGLNLVFDAWFENWKHGRGNYMPVTETQSQVEFHLSPGLKKKDIHKAFLEHLLTVPEHKEQTPDVSFTNKRLRDKFPDVKKRKWIKFTKCSICTLIDDKISKSVSQELKGE